MYLPANKYHTWYHTLILAASHRQLEDGIYFELHHIIPKSFYKSISPTGWLDGNPNETSNLVKLTAREHYIAHRLLTKMTYGSAHAKMINAIWFMSQKVKRENISYISATAYEQARMSVSQLTKERWAVPQTRLRMVQAQRASVTQEKRDTIRSRMRSRWLNTDYATQQKWKSNLSLGTAAASNKIQNLNTEERTEYIDKQRTRGRKGGSRNAERIQSLVGQERDTFLQGQADRAANGGAAAKKWLASLTQEERKEYLARRWHARRAKLAAKSPEEQITEQLKRKDAAVRAAEKRRLNRLANAQINSVNQNTSVEAGVEDLSLTEQQF